MQELKDVEEFCRQHVKLFLYGNGDIQIKVKEVLEKKGFTFAGIIVSKTRYKQGRNCFTIKEIAGEIHRNNNIGIVIPLSDRHIGEVLGLLYEQEIKPDQFIWISNYVKYHMLPVTEKKHGTELRTLNRFLKLYDDVTNLCREGQYNLFCHRHLGDTLVLMGLKTIFEQTYNASLHYIIPNNQEPITKLYSVTDYSLIDYDSYFDDCFDDNDSDRDRDIYRRDICESIFSSLPQMSIPFVASTPVNWVADKSRQIVSFKDDWARRLGFEAGRLAVPEIPDSISEVLKEKISKIDKPENMVLMLPETATLPMLPMDFWVNLAKEKSREGYTVITNAINEKNIIPGTICLDLSLEELLVLGKKCHSIYSMRSGVCDCLVERGHDLHVFYGDHPNAELFFLDKCFVIEDKVDEITDTDRAMKGMSSNGSK